MTDDLPFLEAMRAQIRATPLPVDAETPRRRRPALPRLAFVSGGALALAAIAVAAVLIVTAGSGAPPAYAASFHTIAGQRTVTITLRQEQDIPKLDALLAAEHTRIRVVPVVRGCDAPVHFVSRGQVVPGPAKTLLSRPTYQDGKLLRIVSQTIFVNTIAGRTFVVAYGDEGGYSFGGGVVVGPAPSCVGIGPRDDVTTSR